MAFFKFRKAAGETAAPAPAPESVEAMRKRARYRLAGAAMLVLAGVIGFPLLFDNQPRPIAVDIPIEIPDKAKVKPLVATESKASEPVAAAPAPAPAPEKAQVVAASPAASEARAPEKEEVIVAVSKPEAKPAEKPKDAAKDHKEVTGRFVVQFGAFAESARAHEARVKVEKLGMKTYAQVAETSEGKKIRVRVGPFEKRSDAEKAAEKIKKLDLPAAILGL